MYGLINKGPQIIREASKTILGFSAAVVLVLSIVGLVLFAGQSVLARLIVFFAMLVGLLMFALAVVRIASRPGSPPPSVTETEEERKVVGSRVEPDRGLRAHQAAAVCYRRRGGRLEFLLIRSSGGRRIFPKGNPKEGEALWAAAEREAREEAGAIGELNREALTIFWQRKGRRKGRRQEFAVAAFLLEVDRQLLEHKEGRKPKWYEPEDAERVLCKKRDSQEAKEFQRVIRLARAEIERDAAGGGDGA
jgi:8-oxo-dGTP pyrophosphatase MutT (NUDIX family)